ncbi:MAG: hypothetical protein AABX47_06455 [Nanoarchaeota archaeon]
MARLSSSIDIGEELDHAEKSRSHPSQHPQHPTAEHNGDHSRTDAQPSHPSPNVSLRWHRNEASHKDQEPADNLHRHEKEKNPSSRTLMWACAAMIFVILFSIYQFRATEDFPGIETAVAKQMNDALTYEISQGVAKDYKSVSEARKRYMFNQKFEEVSKSAQFKQIVWEKQESTKDLFRDGHGMPYLYSPESYRYAEAARQQQGIGTGQMRLSEEDKAAGRAIFTFHRYSSIIRPSDSIDWSAFYLPVVIGAIVVALASMAAFFLTLDPAAILFTGLALSMHPFSKGIFSAGSPHPSTTFFVSFTLAIALLSSAALLKGWKAWISIALMALISITLPSNPLTIIWHLLILITGVILIHKAVDLKSSPKILTGTVLIVLGSLSLYYIGQPTYASIKMQTLLIGRGIIALAAISSIAAVWGMAKQREGSAGLACAAAAALGAMIASNKDPSGIMPLILTCALIGASGSHAYLSIADAFAKNSKGKTPHMLRGALLALTLLVISGASYLAAGSSFGIVLPGVDDSVANASISLKMDAKAGAVFLSDPSTSDPIRYMSGVEPTLVNSSDQRLILLFAKAMSSNDENESRLIIETLACPAATESLTQAKDISSATLKKILEEHKPGCPSQKYLIVTDRTFSQLIEYAIQSGIDTQGQKMTMPSQCEIKPTGGIRCGNGFELLDLNATIQGEFPGRMVSFIGNKRIVNYSNHKVTESFVIYRENGKLYSMIVPSSLDGSLLVRALGHDDIPFLEETAAAENPTHSIVYRIVDWKAKKSIAGGPLGEPTKDIVTTYRP